MIMPGLNHSDAVAVISRVPALKVVYFILCAWWQAASHRSYSCSRTRTCRMWSLLRVWTIARLPSAEVAYSTRGEITAVSMFPSCFTCVFFPSSVFVMIYCTCLINCSGIGLTERQATCPMPTRPEAAVFECFTKVSFGTSGYSLTWILSCCFRYDGLMSRTLHCIVGTGYITCLCTDGSVWASGSFRHDSSFFQAPSVLEVSICLYAVHIDVRISFILPRADCSSWFRRYRYR